MSRFDEDYLITDEDENYPQEFYGEPEDDEDDYPWWSEEEL